MKFALACDPLHSTPPLRGNQSINQSYGITTMLARVSSETRRRAQQSCRNFATVEKTSGGAIGSDGRHEIWRGDVDHDNEPKVS